MRKMSESSIWPYKWVRGRRNLQCECIKKVCMYTVEIFSPFPGNVYLFIGFRESSDLFIDHLDHTNHTTKRKEKENGEVVRRDKYSSGQDYLDADRGSCLMNTPLEHCVKQWALSLCFLYSVGLTACRTCAVIAYCCSSISNSTFPGLGFDPQSRQFFVMWLQWQLILINR